MRRKETLFIAATLVVIAGLALAVLPRLFLAQATHSSTEEAPTSVSYTASSTSVIAASVVGSPSVQGLELLLGANTTNLTVGQRLWISVDLRNLFSNENDVPPVDIPSNASNITPYANAWHFRGFPIAVWPGCALQVPLQFIVLKGFYGTNNLTAGINGTPLRAGPLGGFCMESDRVTSLVFQPNSDFANMSSVYVSPISANNLGNCSRPTVLYRMASNFTVSGYWNEASINSSELESTPAGPNARTFGFPEVAPYGQTPFVPGVYTLVVSDEWGATGLFALHGPLSDANIFLSSLV